MGEHHQRRGRNRQGRKKKLISIDELLGYALGAVGLSLDDFCRLTPREYGEVCKAWQGEEERRFKDAWERMRLMTSIIVQPHVKKKMDPKKMLPFPWERKKPKAEEVSREEAKRRFEKLTKHTEK